MLNNLLDIPSVLLNIGSILLAVLLLLVMVTVHEFGHYITGKILKFKINEFSVGFGPALFSKTNKKTGEKFSLRLIPLGGYCAFAGEEGKSVEEEKLKSLSSEDVFFDETVTPSTARKDAVDDSGYFYNQAPWKRIIVLISGAAMNYLLALVIIFISFFSFGQLLLMTHTVAPAEGVASEYCFQDRDVILEAEGRSVYMTTDLMNALKDREAGDEVEFLVSRLTDEKTGIREEVFITVQLRSATNFENSADADRLWEALGIAKQTDANGNVITDENGNPAYLIYSTSYRFGFFKTIANSFVYSFKIAASIFQVLGELLMGVLGLENLGGPITTITITSQVLSRGIQPFLEIAAYIGVNLAVFNLLPIPALDGSKVIFTAIEWVRGKPINEKVEMLIHTVGMLLLFGFAILVDILQFI